MLICWSVQRRVIGRAGRPGACGCSRMQPTALSACRCECKQMRKCWSEAGTPKLGLPRQRFCVTIAGNYLAAALSFFLFFFCWVFCFFCFSGRVVRSSALMNPARRSRPVKEGGFFFFLDFQTSCPAPSPPPPTPLRWCQQS